MLVQLTHVFKININKNKVCAKVQYVCLPGEKYQVILQYIY